MYGESDQKIWASGFLLHHMQYQIILFHELLVKEGYIPVCQSTYALLSGFSTMNFLLC